MHESLGGAFPKRHHVDCGVIAIICKVPVLGHHSFNMLGSCVEVVDTNNEEIKVPIPSKLLELHEALENNFDWICPKNLFNEMSEPKSVHKGYSKTHLDTIQFIVEKTSAIDLNASFDIT
jgi:hypothetical protein